MASFSLNVNANNFYPSSVKEEIERDKDQLNAWGFSDKTIRKIKKYLTEWHSMPLKTLLTQWDKVDMDTKSRNTSTLTKKLNMCQYNVEGWKSRKLEAIDLIQTMEAAIGVWTEVGSQGEKFQIPEYTTFYQKGCNRSGGVCVSVGKNLKPVEVKTTMLNTVIIDIYGLNEPIRIVGIYWPPTGKRNLNELSEFIINNTIVMGDFNAALEGWRSPKDDSRGIALQKWTEENNLNYIKNTFNSSKRSKRNIDLLFTNIKELKGETIKFGTSDHWPILYSSECINFPTHFYFPITNWKEFEILVTILQNFWIELQERIPLDEWYNLYIAFLAATKNRVTNWKSKEKFRPSLPNNIREKLKALRVIRNNYYRKRRYDVDSEPERVLLRTLNREVQVEIANYRSNRWSQFLEKIQESKNTKSEKIFWSHLGSIYKQKTLPFEKIRKNNKIITDKGDIAEELYNYYKEQFLPPPIDLNDETDVEIEKEYLEIKEELAKLNCPVESATEKEISDSIRSLRPKKPAGYDSVSNFMLKLLPPGYVQCLRNCFNTWLKECRFPQEWKIAKVVSLNKLKTGIPQADQTRPISLLATHSKIFEKILLSRIREWAERNSIVPIEQSGFRPNCLIPTRVLSIYQEVHNNMAGNIPTLALYVDYQKAYDRVWHAALMVKLNRFDIPKELLKIIGSWLSQRSAYVAYGDINTKNFPIEIGLPQGSSLSPYVFIIFHSDLVKSTGAFATHIFADDLCVLIRAPIERKLEPMLQVLEKEGTKVCNELFGYSKKWKQPINITKTVYQVFHSQIKIRPLEVLMNKIPLQKVDDFKYLGYNWTSKLSMRKTIAYNLEKIEKSYKKLKWLKKNKKISKQVLRQCFFTYSFPFFAWLFCLFPILPTSQQNLLRRKYRVGLRIIYRCYELPTNELHTFTQEKELDYYIKKYINKRLKRIYKSDLSSSFFLSDLDFWPSFKKGKKDGLGQYFRQRRIKNLIDHHKSVLGMWLDFAQ